MNNAALVQRKVQLRVIRPINEVKKKLSQAQLFMIYSKNDFISNFGCIE